MRANGMLVIFILLMTAPARGGGFNIFRQKQRTLVKYPKKWNSSKSVPNHYGAFDGDHKNDTPITKFPINKEQKPMNRKLIATFPENAKLFLINKEKNAKFFKPHEIGHKLWIQIDEESEYPKDFRLLKKWLLQRNYARITDWIRHKPFFWIARNRNFSEAILRHVNFSLAVEAGIPGFIAELPGKAALLQINKKRNPEFFERHEMIEQKLWLHIYEGSEYSNDLKSLQKLMVERDYEGIVDRMSGRWSDSWKSLFWETRNRHFSEAILLEALKSAKNDETKKKIFSLAAEMDLSGVCEKIPSFKKHELNEANAEEICSICIDSMKKEKSTTTPCGYQFHPACLNEWTEIKANCPNCRSPLSTKISEYFKKAVQNNSLKCVKIIIPKMENLDVEVDRLHDMYPLNALQFVATRDKNDWGAMCEILLENGMEQLIDKRLGRYEGTPLMVATDSHNPKPRVVQCLSRRKKYDLESVNKHFKETALHMAVRRGHEEVCEILLENGADVKKEVFLFAIKKEIALCRSRRKKYNLETVNDHFEETALHMAVRRGHEEVCEILLENGADVKKKVFLFAIKKEIALCRSRRKKYNLETVNNHFERTALNMAVRRDHDEVCEILLENGADVKESALLIQNQLAIKKEIAFEHPSCLPSLLRIRNKGIRDKGPYFYHHQIPYID